jgi:hypothetical protein
MSSALILLAGGFGGWIVAAILLGLAGTRPRRWS